MRMPSHHRHEPRPVPLPSVVAIPPDHHELLRSLVNRSVYAVEVPGVGVPFDALVHANKRGDQVEPDGGSDIDRPEQGQAPGVAPKRFRPIVAGSAAPRGTIPGRTPRRQTALPRAHHRPRAPSAAVGRDPGRERADRGGISARPRVRFTAASLLGLCLLAEFQAVLAPSLAIARGPVVAPQRRTHSTRRMRVGTAAASP